MKPRKNAEKSRCRLCNNWSADSSVIFCENCLDIWNLFPPKVRMKLRILLDK